MEVSNETSDSSRTFNFNGYNYAKLICPKTLQCESIAIGHEPDRSFFSYAPLERYSRRAFEY